MPPAVAGKQPGLTGRHPALLARNAPPFMQYLEQDGRENDVAILLALAQVSLSGQIEGGDRVFWARFVRGG